MELQSDFRDLLQAFADAEVRYLVVGGYAVGFHGTPRFTKDIDLWIEPSDENLARVEAALDAFGAPRHVIEQLRTAALDDVLWMGAPPMRADILKGVPGGDFPRAYATRIQADWAGVPVCMIGLDELIAIKRASGRKQDLLDVELLTRDRTAGG